MHSRLHLICLLSDAICVAAILSVAVASRYLWWAGMAFMVLGPCLAAWLRSRWNRPAVAAAAALIQYIAAAGICLYMLTHAEILKSV